LKTESIPPLLSPSFRSHLRVSFDLRKQELVARRVGVREVELDLLADLERVRSGEGRRSRSRSSGGGGRSRRRSGFFGRSRRRSSSGGDVGRHLRIERSASMARSIDQSGEHGERTTRREGKPEM
jgi:hypothetical protein